ncbi:gastrula zinc finger protein XlCGF57.1-like isoform X2 [Onychostoma macrolepis]|uniref:gastrula zinc finger protein XlCGF57.1-like isoform X2 n=1 Tax=Onychostoma macrolepis TaxID=369639 RepID=UPI00272BC24B|nr:gastrula zinc finger protein XlCGF57.1-like isoform X2 [Onychostoma macrolepis]
MEHEDTEEHRDLMEENEESEELSEVEEKLVKTREKSSKSFTRKGHLKKNVKTHTGEKQHTCDQCGKSFTKKGYLKYHMKIHTGEKAHTCDQCGSAFTQKGALKEHIKIHTERSRTHVISAGRDSNRHSLLNYICVLILEKDHLTVINVIKPLFGQYL